MKKKLIFIDLDGTLINQGNRDINQTTVSAINQAHINGHKVILSTGRPPVLFYDIDKKLGLNSYISCNGRYVMVDGNVIYADPIPTEMIKSLVDYCEQMKIDLSFQNKDDYILQSNYDVLYQKFSDNFNMDYPILKPGFYKNIDVYQMGLYYDKDDFGKFNDMFPTLSFHFSCKYGLDVNAKGGMKELGLEKIVEYLEHDMLDTIAIGDGYNDIGMIKMANVGVAMGNAPDDVKRHADFIARNVEDDAIYHIFKDQKII